MESVKIIPQWREPAMKGGHRRPSSTTINTLGRYINAISYITDGSNETYASVGGDDSPAYEGNYFPINKNVLAGQISAAIPNNAKDIRFRFMARINTPQGGSSLSGRTLSIINTPTFPTATKQPVDSVDIEVTSTESVDKIRTYTVWALDKSNKEELLSVFTELEYDDIVLEQLSPHRAPLYLYDVWIDIYYSLPNIKIKAEGEWTHGEIKAKVNGEWVDAESIHVKVDGAWIEVN